MGQIYNIYCDESSHLEHDRQPVMVLGAVWCPLEQSAGVAQELRDIKLRHGLPADFEVKWSKVSPAKQAFYLNLVEYFFNTRDLHFRALVVPDKSILDHQAFGQDHDTWYYKMYFEMLKVLISPEDEYRIYLDIKDTRSAEKLRRLHEVLCNNILDYEREVVVRVQAVRSHQVEQVQLADLLIGAVSYANRGLVSNAGKVALVERIRARSRYSLKHTTLFREPKVNLLRWRPRDGGGVE